MRGIRSSAAIAAALIVTCAVTGCGASISASTASDSLINVSLGGTGQFTDDFNPFSPNAAGGTRGVIYEPLMFFDIGKANDIQPELATGYKFSDGGRTLTFTIRKGVTWSDGKPFTADDVAFTFDLIKDTPSLNTGGLQLQSATATDPTDVTLKFTSPQYTNLWSIAGLTYIVPEHIWQNIKNPSTFTNPKPVGTGPFILGAFSPQQYVVTRNPHYWEPGKPEIAGLRFLSYDGNDSASAALAAGQLDWDSVFMPNVQKQFVDMDPAHNKYLNMPTVTTVLLPNLDVAPMNDLAVRQAISAALNRDEINKLAFASLASPASASLLVRPAFSSYISPAAAAETLAYDPAKARQILQQAGYTLGANGMFAKDGHPLSITCVVTAGYTDWITMLQIISQQLKAVGIALNVEQESEAAVNSAEQNGTFQLAVTDIGAVPSPYYAYNSVLNSAYTAPAGKPAVSNFARFSNPTVDQALAAIANINPSDVAAVKSQLATVQQVLISQLPYIPVVQAAGLMEYRTTKATGWPTASNPYAEPQPFYQPDLGIVAKNLVPANG
jgi:peptide/nickel transport system substrate-binding protein